MTISRTPPPEATKEHHRLSAAWSVVRRRKTDPKSRGWPRLSLKSTQEFEIAFGEDLHSHAYVAEYDLERKGIWICLVPVEAADRRAANRFYQWKLQTRLNFMKMTGDYKTMGTDFHNVFVEVWTLDKQYWLFADMTAHTEMIQRFRGPGLRS